MMMMNKHSRPPRLRASWLGIIIVAIILHLNVIMSSNHEEYVVDRVLKGAVQIQTITVPDILLIGAMKCGTTSLHRLLIQHPNDAICGYGEKEKHFFNSHDYATKYTKHVEHYYKEFSGCNQAQKTIDSTPGYAVNEDVTHRVKESYTPEDLAKKKIIFIIREPVARHYSEYQMALRLCLDINDDLAKKGPDHEWRVSRHETACKQVAHPDYYDAKKNSLKVPAKVLTFREWSVTSYGRKELRRGHYRKTIDDWLQIVSREQMFILNFQTMIYNSSDTMTRLSHFLELDSDWGSTAKLPTPETQKAVSYLDCLSVQRLSAYFAKANGPDDFIDFIENKSGHKPLQEPAFGSFENTFTKCVNATTPKGLPENGEDMSIEALERDE